MRRERPNPRAVTSWVTGALVFVFASHATPQFSPVSPASPDARERFVNILRLRGEGAREQALEDAKALVHDHPDFGKAHRLVADLYLDLGDAAAARDYYDDLLAKSSSNPYARYGAGRVDFFEGDLDGAIEQLERAAALEPTFAEVFGLDGGLVEMYEARRDLSAAISYFEALTLSNPSHANAFSGLGWSHARSFQFDRAVAAFTRALELAPDLTQAYHGLIQSYFRTGRYQKSLDACHALSEAARRGGELEMVAYAKMMQGTIAYSRGDYRSALSHLQESQTLAKEIGDEAREASSVNNTAAVYATAREYEKALEYFELSRDLARRSGAIQAEVNALGNIGTAHREARRFEQALAHYRDAVALARGAGFRNQLSAALANMGGVFQRLGDRDEASSYYNEALTIAEEIRNTTIEAFALGSLGDLKRELGDFDEAIRYFERELLIGEQTGEVQAIWEAQAGLGATYETLGDADNAMAHYAEAIAHYDAVRADLAIESLGASFLEDKHEAYPSMVQLLAAQGAYEEAFAYAEKFKAKGFLDILTRGRTLFETQLPEGLRLELDDVRTALQRGHAELSLARSASVLDATATIVLEERVTELEIEKSALVDRVRDSYGEFYELALSEPIDVARLQSEILEPRQILVEYLLGRDRLSVFVITRDELHYREVPVGREELRRQFTELSPLFESNGASGAQARGRLFNAALADFSLPPAETLYATLLEPIREWLPEDAELIIVPDDFLFYLPFEALVVESQVAEHRYDFSAATFVVERHAVSYSPSASLLDPGLRRPRVFDRGVLAFGNPSFDETRDDRPRLPNAEAEVEAIDEAFAGYDNNILTGDVATEAAFKQEGGRYGVLHFATHFASDDEQPLYSRLLLARDDDGAEDDGVLQTYEIFDATLNAELAVLSACNTGLGSLRKGEGLVGISRAFLYAGVPSLVVSLWSVDDAATSQIMGSFYRRLRSGASKKQALRLAKLDYLRASEGDELDPFYWAPFILSGDWEPLSFPAPRKRRWEAPVMMALALSGALFLWTRRRSPA
jgi:CHAT domain-containing protein/Tfp pilus assembly protein PilF